MKIILAGASGFIGQQLIPMLEKSGHQVTALTRKHFKDNDFTALHDAELVINLVGAPIAKRWTKAYKQELYDSRIQTTKQLVEAINKSPNIQQFITTSATGIYSPVPSDEDAKDLSDGFLGKLTQDWEKEAQKCQKPTTILRLGVILGKEGGALKKMLLPFQLCLGGRISDGQFMMSFLSIKDLLRLYTFIIDKKITGTFNAVIPTPVSNIEFTKTLGKAMKRPTVFPVPKWVLHLLFSEGASVLTTSQEVYPKRLQELGFTFKYPTVKTILNDLFKHKQNKEKKEKDDKL